jgi:hypothetical protein
MIFFFFFAMEAKFDFFIHLVLLSLTHDTYTNCSH